MADELPEWVMRGEAARLFPVLAETSKEGRAPVHSARLLRQHRRPLKHPARHPRERTGRRTQVQTFTEVELETTPAGATGRPDGLIVVSTGRRDWTALVEAKVGRSKLDEGQIETCLEMARVNELNALVTISNDFAAVPDHHPMYARRTRAGVSLPGFSILSPAQPFGCSASSPLPSSHVGATGCLRCC